MSVETDDETGDTKGTYATGLSVTLLNTGDVSSDVFDRDGVFDGETMRLTFDARFVDQDTRVGRQSCSLRSQH